MVSGFDALKAPSWHIALDLACATSCRVHVNRTAHSGSEYPSRIDMTNENRGKFVNRVMTSNSSGMKGSAVISASQVLSLQSETGLTMRIAFLIIARLLQEKAHSLKTEATSKQSCKLETKHSSAASRSAVSKNASRYS